MIIIGAFSNVAASTDRADITYLPPVGINFADWIPVDKTVEIESSLLSERVAGQPTAVFFIPIPVVYQVRLIILEFGREPDWVGLGHGAGGADEIPEGAVTRYLTFSQCTSALGWSALMNLRQRAAFLALARSQTQAKLKP